MPKAKVKPPESYSVNALSKLTGADRKTIDKAIARAQIKPAGIVKGCPTYRLEDIQAALASKPDKSLKDEKLIEEIREKRLKNDLAEGKLMRKAVVNTVLQQGFGEITRLLDQKLENEFPALVQGLDIAGCRIKGKQLNDSIRAELRKICEAWPE